MGKNESLRNFQKTDNLGEMFIILSGSFLFSKARLIQTYKAIYSIK